MSDQPGVFERAADLVANQLAFFRDDCSEPTANDRLMAGHIVGNLMANDLINRGDEVWVSVESETDAPNAQSEGSVE